MASPAPAKSQPLHNFSLPLLKWSKNHSSNHHRGRRPADSPPPPDSIVRKSPSSETAARRHSPLLDSARLRQSPLLDSARLRQSPLLDSARRQSPMRDSASESDSGYGSERRRKSASESGRISLFVSPPRDHVTEKSEKRPTAAEAAGGSAHKESRSSKIYIRIPKTMRAPPDVADEGKKPKSTDIPIEPKKPKSTDAPTEPRKAKSTDVPFEPKKVEDEGKKVLEGMDFEEYEGKTWNLRPRKPLNKKPNGNANAGSSRGGGGGAPPQEARSQAQVTNRPEASSSRGGGAQATAEKKEKRPRFSIALTRQEIEDDIYSMSGSKPNRRPKKRAKAVQKQLDNLFPGLWLVNVTPDLYKVSESTPKKLK